MVYVQDINGNPLMPSTRHGHIRRLLKQEKAHIIKRCPFTIQLNYQTTTETQDITLGVDAGSKTIGISATTEKKVLFESEMTLRNDIVKLIATRRELRSTRRNRKTRYRKPKFKNRAKPKGWLAPSVQNKINTHLTVIQNVTKLLPITKIIVEVASFDIQKIKAVQNNKPVPQGKDYQQGEQLSFWNVREYVLFRDGHKCQCCKGKSKDHILNIHHIESRKTGGDAPNNLITLCETCHNAYHQNKITLPKHIKRGMSFRDTTFMGIMRWSLYDKLKETHDNVSLTYGYITKNTRITNNLPKAHYIDARCISGNPLALPTNEIFFQKKVRCHNRQLHKMTIRKGGYRTANQAPKYIHGFQLFDKIKLGNVEGFVFGRRKRGYFDIRLLDNSKLSASVSYKKLKLLESRKSILIERRCAVPPRI